MSNSDKATDHMCGLCTAEVRFRCEFHTFDSPADGTEANVSNMKRADNVLHYMCMYVVIRRRGRGMCYRIRVLCVQTKDVVLWWRPSFWLICCVYRRSTTDVSWVALNFRSVWDVFQAVQAAPQTKPTLETSQDFPDLICCILKRSALK